jgi:hypothetical protein
VIVPDRAAASLLAEHLQRGEQLVWFERAAPRAVEAHVARLAVVGVVSGGVAVAVFLFHAWAAASSASADPALTASVRDLFASAGVQLVGAILLAVGLCAALAFAWARFVAGRTAYAITPNRLIFMQGGQLGSLWKEPFELVDVELVERADGTGDLIFRKNRTAPLGSTWARAVPMQRSLAQDVAASLSGGGDDELEAFVGIRDARRVRDLIVQTFQRQPDAPAPPPPPPPPLPPRSPPGPPPAPSSPVGPA